jgi:leader peptidase (prepilin peptidase)/N-methyltransferase
LGTGIGFSGLFYLEIVANIHDLPYFAQKQWEIKAGLVPWQGWAFFGHHAVLLSLLIVAAGCDLGGRTIPLSLTMFGTGIGLIGAVLFPWPWPNDINGLGIVPPHGQSWWMALPGQLGRGLYPWPVWGPLPNWMPLGSHPSGLATGVAGILVGTWMLRSVRAIFTKGLGKEALGLGDADLMMMAGAFLGWQPVVVAFFVGAVASLGFAIANLIFYKDASLPFGPGLAAGIIITWLCWQSIGPAVQVLLFNGPLLLICVGFGAGFMFLSSAFLRMIKPRPPSKVP